MAVAALSVVFALLAADGGLLASFRASDVKASVFVTSISPGIYLAARIAGRLPQPGQACTGYAAPPENEAPQEAGRRVPSGLGWPGDTATRREAGSQQSPAPRGEP